MEIDGLAGSVDIMSEQQWVQNASVLQDCVLNVLAYVKGCETRTMPLLAADAYKACISDL